MAFTQIAGIAPNYRDYKNWWLKSYEPGTTTPKLMSDNDAGSPTSAKYELNKDGFIVSSGGTLIIPHIDGDYDLWLFPTEAEADANDTTNAERLADDLKNYLTNTSLGNSLGGFVSYEFDTVADAKIGLTIGGQTVTLKENDVIRIKERYSALFDVISGTGTANGFGIIAHGSLDLSFSIRTPNSNPKSWGVVADGIADDKPAFESIFAAGQLELKTDESDVYQFNSTLNLTGINGIKITGKGTFKLSSFQQAIVFNNCDNLVISGVRGLGSLDRAAWEALTPTERQSQIAFFEFEECFNTMIEDSFVSGFSQGIKATNCNFCEWKSNTLLGCFGELSGGLVTDPNFGYGLFIDGGENHIILNPTGEECSGAVLLGNIAERVKSYGGTCKNIHDNGWYGSSCDESLCHGFACESGGIQSNAVKMRGNNNMISNCVARNVQSIAFIIAPLATISAIDPQGAAGFGGGIYYCEAQNCSSLLRVDFSEDSGTNLYMRDVGVFGNKGFDLTSATLLPIEVFAIKNVEVANNEINTFATTSGAVFVGGESAGQPVTNVNIHHNHFESGEKLIAYTFATNCKFNNNTFENMTGGVILNTINTGVDNEYIGNKSSDKTKRLDLRQSSGSFGSVAFDNDLFIQCSSNIQGECRAGRNELDTNIDTTAIIPYRVGDIVKSSIDNKMYIADNTTMPADWNALY